MPKVRVAVGAADPQGRVWRGERSGIWCYECLTCGRKGAYDDETKTRSVLADHLSTHEETTDGS